MHIEIPDFSTASSVPGLAAMLTPVIASLVEAHNAALPAEPAAPVETDTPADVTAEAAAPVDAPADPSLG